MSADVAVYGATAAGVCAAVAAAGQGMRVRLLEPGRHIGGMVSGGLGYTDVGDRRVLGGLARAFAVAVAERYDTPLWTWAGPEPHVAEAIFTEWLERAGVEVVFDAPLLSVSGSIDSVRTAAGEETAGAFIDASYEGDLLAAAGVPYEVGREGRHRYGERLAGRVEAAAGKHNFPPFLSPLDGAKLLPLVHERPLADVGAGDAGSWRTATGSASPGRPTGSRSSGARGTTRPSGSWPAATSDGSGSTSPIRTRAISSG